MVVRLVECERPERALEYYHMRSAANHLTEAEKIAKAYANSDTLEIINGAQCQIQRDAQSFTTYVWQMACPLAAMMGDDSGSKKIHNVRMDIETTRNSVPISQAALNAKRSAGASALVDHLHCASELLSPYDPYPWVHPVSSGGPAMLLFAELMRRAQDGLHQKEEGKTCQKASQRGFCESSSVAVRQFL